MKAFWSTVLKMLGAASKWVNKLNSIVSAEINCDTELFDLFYRSYPRVNCPKKEAKCEKVDHSHPHIPEYFIQKKGDNYGNALKVKLCKGVMSSALLFELASFMQPPPCYLAPSQGFGNALHLNFFSASLTPFKI